MLKKIWGDTVWSKVISAVIIAVGSFLISVVYSYLTKLTLKDSISFLWNYQIKLGSTLLLIILGILILAIIQKIAKKSPTKSEKLQIKFHKEFRKFIDTGQPITYRFNAYISSRTNFPFISDLRVYCTAHKDRETLMTPRYGCPFQDCERHGASFDEDLLKNQIETDLLGEWEKMNK